MSQNNNLCPKKAAGKAGQVKRDVVVNAYPVKRMKNMAFYKYDLHVTAHFESGKTRELTKIERDDYSEVMRKSFVTAVVAYLKTNYSDVFHDEIFTDRAKGIYSLGKYDIPKDGKKFEVPPDAFRTDCVRNATKYEIAIKPVSDSFQGSTNDLDNFCREFLSVAITRNAYNDNDRFTVHNNNVYCIQPTKCGFTEFDSPNLPGMAKVLPIIKKSLKVVEGNNGRGELALIIDVSKSPVHLPCMLHEKVHALATQCGRGARPGAQVNYAAELNKPNLFKCIKGLECVPVHRAEARSIIVKSVGGPANKEVIAEKNKTVAQYFAAQYKCNLKHPEWPTIRDIRSNLYPLEVLRVLDFQRVRKGQEHPDMTDKVIRASAVLPHLRKEQTKTALKALGIPDDQMLQKCGVTVGRDLTVLTSARQLRPPMIVYANKGTENVSYGKWRLNNHKYFLPAKITKWSVWGNVYERDLDALGAFVDSYMKRAAARGLQLPAPQKLHVSMDQIEPHMAQAAKDGVQFVLLVSEDREDDHNLLKYLEVTYQVATQQVTISVARKAVERNQMVTFDNIVLKTNIKNKGLCHDIYMGSAQLQELVSNPTRLIVGIQMSHPAAGFAGERAASVIGWAANVLPHPSQYTGNFIFTEPRNAEPDVVPVFQQILGRMKRHNRRPPANIDIYMQGITEGNLARMSNHVLSCCQKTLEQFGIKSSPNITIIVCADEHVERFYHLNIDANEKSAGRQSVPSGLVVDKEIVSPARNEFFLLAHNPVQGTASVPKYIVAVDTSGKRTMDEIEQATYGLCHLHQYATMTTSLPTPLYCASDYAQRGHSILPEIQRKDLPDGEWSIEALNQVSYQKKVLESARMA